MKYNEFPAMQIETPGDQAFWIKRASLLCWFTIVYNLIEGIVSIAFGVHDEAVSLAGFGVDSFIEVASAFIVLRRFAKESGADEALPVEAERRATLAIGRLFLALAAVTLGASVYRLSVHGSPDTTIPGLVISAISVSFMFFLWAAKREAGRALDSKTVMQDAACSMACIQLSFVLLLGSLVYLAAPALWWADSAAALAIGALIAREGFETVQAAKSPDFTGGCGCSSC